MKSMKYMELMNYLSTLNIETIDLGSPELLATIIILGIISVTIILRPFDNNSK